VFIVGIASSALTMEVYAQFSENSIEISEPVIFSDDLLNNPTAQEIMKKIEQTKKWIKDLEQRNYDHLEAQKELEEKRSQALTKLEQDLKEWEELWQYYSPRNSFGRFIDKVPDLHVQGVFWDQFEFKEQKVNAGREALKKVIANGGTLQEARQAYHTAAETKRIELIEANSMFNVNHNLAYYNQQILFDREGQFINSTTTGEILRKYYQEYRTNPSYLKENPNDSVSWEDLGKTSSGTECIRDEIIVHRFHANDYVCVTMYTAEMWIRHGMGEITGDSKINYLSLGKLVTPLTKCDDGFMVIFETETKKYSCILADTANQWMTQGIAEFHDPESFIMQSIDKKSTDLKIEEINQQIRKIESEFEEQKAQLKKDYDKTYDDALEQSKQEEKDAIKDQSERSGMTKEELSNKISTIREHYESVKEDIMREKTQDADALDKAYKHKMKEFAKEYDPDPSVEIVKDSTGLYYEAIPKN
jgi:hypothetical protein